VLPRERYSFNNLNKNRTLKGGLVNDYEELIDTYGISKLYKAVRKLE